MKIRRILGLLIALILALGLGWWLLRDALGLRAPVQVIRFIHSGTSEDSEFWQRVIHDFEKAHRRTRVKQESVPNERFAARLREDNADKKPPQVVLMPHTAFPELSDNFEVLHGSDLKKEDNIASAGFQEYPTIAQALDSKGLKAFAINHEQRALPVYGGNLLIFLNLQCFAKASEFHTHPVKVPADDWTIADFLRTAEQLTCDFNRDGITDQFGFQLPSWSNFLPFLWTFGANLTDESRTRWTLLGPPAQAAMRFYRRLATGDRVSPRWEDMPGLSPDEGFLTGKIAMRVDGPWFIPAVEDSVLAKDYAVVPIPRGPGEPATAIVWNGIALRKGLTDRERAVAWSFIQFALSKEVQSRLAERSFALPARREVHDIFAASDPSRRRAFITSLPYARLQPALPDYEALDRTLARYFDDAADPLQLFDAPSLLEALARDPTIIGAFSGDSSLRSE